MGRSELTRELQALDELRFRTGPAGRRLFFPNGTHRAGRVIPDQRAEEEVRRLLEQQREVTLRLSTLAVVVGVPFFFLLRRVLGGLVGEWPALATTGVILLTEVGLLSAVVVARYRSDHNRLLRLVAAWPEVPPLHSRGEALRERLGVSASSTPAWKAALYLLTSALFALVGVAMFLTADKPADRLLGMGLAAFFALGAGVMAAGLVIRFVWK